MHAVTLIWLHPIFYYLFPIVFGRVNYLFHIIGSGSSTCLLRFLSPTIGRAFACISIKQRHQYVIVCHPTAYGRQAFDNRVGRLRSNAHIGAKCI